MDKGLMLRRSYITCIFLFLISFQQAFSSSCYSCQNIQLITDSVEVTAFYKTYKNSISGPHCKSVTKDTPKSPCHTTAGFIPHIDEKCSKFTGEINIRMITNFQNQYKIKLKGNFRQCVGVGQSYTNKCYTSGPELDYLANRLLLLENLKIHFSSYKFLYESSNGEYCLCDETFCNNDCENGIWLSGKYFCFKYWLIGVVSVGGLLVLIGVIIIVVFFIKRSRGKTPAIQPQASTPHVSMSAGIAFPPSGLSMAKAQYAESNGYPVSEPPPYPSDNNHYESLNPRY